MSHGRASLLFYCFALLAASAGAQSSVFATLSGRVTDASSAVVQDATVILTNQGTNERVQTTTDALGRFLFPRAVPGTYSLEVEKPGFRRTVVDTLTLAVNDSVGHDVSLAAGEVTETVTVSGGLTSTRGTNISLPIDARSIRELPLNGRDWSTLIALAPGSGLAGGNGPVSGTRSAFNNFTVDGLGQNDERTTGQPVGGGAAAFTAAPNLISTEAIQEFRVITSNADATFGRGSGAQVNVITKSGSNRFSGSLYGFGRDAKLDSRNVFNTGRVPPFTQRSYGTTLGGPLRQDKHFFFVSYEGFRQERQATASLTLPNTDLIGLIPGDLGRLYRAYLVARGLVQSTTGPGEFRALTDSDRNAARAAGFDARWFDGDVANGEAGTLLQTPTVPQDVRQDAVLIRTDHVLSSRWRASGRYGFANPTQTGPQTVPLDLLFDKRQWQSVVGELVGTLTPTQVLEVRGGWLRTRFTQRPDGGVGDAFRAIGVNDDLGLAITSAGTGLSTIGLLGTSGFLDNQSIPQVSALHTWQRRRLTIRSGFDAASYLIDIHNGAGRPAYTFTGFVGTNGLLGASPSQGTAIATSAAASIFGVGGGPTTALRQFTSSRNEYFTQADWQLSNRLTVNAGLRYTYFSAIGKPTTRSPTCMPLTAVAPSCGTWRRSRLAEQPIPWRRPATSSICPIRTTGSPGLARRSMSMDEDGPLSAEHMAPMTIACSSWSSAHRAGW